MALRRTLLELLLLMLLLLLNVRWEEFGRVDLVQLLGGMAGCVAKVQRLGYWIAASGGSLTIQIEIVAIISHLLVDFILCWQQLYLAGFLASAIPLIYMEVDADFVNLLAA